MPNQREKSEYNEPTGRSPDEPEEPKLEIKDAEVDRDFDDERATQALRDAEPEELDDDDILEEIDLDQLELDLDLDEIDHRV
jgi:hypothetical protein